jgi:hypothetical protein
VACNIRGVKIDDQADNRQRLYLDLPDAKASDLDHASQRLRRAHNQTSCTIFEVCAVVCDKPRKRQETLRGCDQKFPRKP